MCDDNREGPDALSDVARRCPVCGLPIPTHGRTVYCSRACQQRAFRLRHAKDHAALQQTWTLELTRRAALLRQTVYECPQCEQRLLQDRRCPDCNLMCKKVGIGGCCPSCDEVLLVADLIGITDE